MVNIPNPEPIEHPCFGVLWQFEAKAESTGAATQGSLRCCDTSDGVRSLCEHLGICILAHSPCEANPWLIWMPEAEQVGAAYDILLSSSTRAYGRSPCSRHQQKSRLVPAVPRVDYCIRPIRLLCREATEALTSRLTLPATREDHEEAYPG